MEPVLELSELSSADELVLGSAYKGVFEKGGIRLNPRVKGVLKGAPQLSDGAAVAARFVKIAGAELVFSFLQAGEVDVRRVEKNFVEKTASDLSDGEQASVTGKIVCVNRAGIDKGYLLDGTGVAALEASELEDGAFVRVLGVAKAGSPPVIVADSVNGVPKGGLGTKIAEYLEKNSEPFSPPLFLDDEVMRTLRPKIAECVRFLKRRLLEFQPLLIRYHGDADGVCSALLFFSAVKKFLSGRGVSLDTNRFLASATQTDSAIYSRADLAADAERAALLPKKPVFVFLDHAANHESFPQLVQLNEGGYEIVIIDHHPPAPGAPHLAKHFVSPFAANGSSDYTAGLLCFELAKAISGGADERLARISLQGDKSVFAPKEPLKEPRVIDYLATYNSPDSLDFYEKILSDSKKVDYYFEEANNRIKRTVAASKPFVKEKRVGSGLIVTVKLDKFCKKGEYPTKGSVLTEIHRSFSGGPVVSLGYGGDAIIFRANQEALDKGFKAGALISQLKEEFPHAVVSGGGHDAAASMRVNEQFLPSVLERAVALAEAVFQ